MSCTGQQRGSKSGKIRLSIVLSYFCYPEKTKPISGRAVFSVQENSKVMESWQIIPAMIQPYPMAEAGDCLANWFDQVENEVS